EALSSADRIAVLQHGKIMQVGTPVELYQAPATAFVADFMGRTNLLEGEIVAVENGSIRIATAAGAVMAAKGPSSGRVTLSIRPERMRIVSKEDPPSANRVTGALLESSFLGESSEHVVGVGSVQMRVIAAPPRLNVTGEVELEFAPADVVVLAR
ncbi:MAG TPA: TOBE domain-containing protein, partial [Steroidobacteraceae bacterium]